jgi:hypothetical protein
MSTRARIVLAGLAPALAVGVPLAFAPSAAPATATPDPPEAVSFSRAVPSIERKRVGEHEEVVRRSVVVRTSRSFDIAGLEGELREYELRARLRDGPWSEWTETAYGDPVWFGNDMKELQVRTHGWKPAGRLGFVDVTASETVVTATRGTDQPPVVSRQEWGANRDEGGCRPRKDPDYGKVKASAVHHTVSANGYSRAEAPGLVLGICQFHRNSNGWDDIGYNTLVDRFGNIYEGRGGGLARAVVGAQAQGVNTQTSGVAILGTHSSTPASKDALKGVARWLAWKLPQHDIGPDGRARLRSAGGQTARYPEGTRFAVPRIFGHRSSNLTECPGTALYGQLDKVRRMVARRIGDVGEDDSGGGGIGS